MNQLLAAVLVLSFVTSASAERNCTDLPKSQWMSEEAFKKKVTDMGYKIKKFKKPGTCYEIYGTDVAGKSVEIYFNPVDATIVKQ
jgi:hypothetical protein